MASSKRQTTQYNNYCKTLSAIKDLYSKAKIFKMFHTDITKEYLLIRESYNKKLNQYYNGLLSGYANCLYDNLWNETEFCYKINGVWYTTHKKDSLKDYYGVTGKFDLKGCECTHLWKNSDRLYTDISIA